VFSAVAFRSAPVPAMAPKAPRASRNKELVRGIGRNGRSKNGGTFPSHEKAAPAAPPAARAPKFYPADDVKTPLHKNKVVNAPKIRYASGFRV
jgi:large subunit ribosomal protein L6e